jgi:hypothetical protein
VAALVSHDMGVFGGEQVDDLGLALVTPLCPDDDGDRHALLQVLIPLPPEIE